MAKKKLEIGKTLIGEKIGTYNGSFVKLEVYYGNYTYPLIDKEYVHLTRDAYMEVLSSFLNSEEGKDFITPSQEEIDDACLKVIEKEIENTKKKLAEQEELNADQNTELEHILNIEGTTEEIKKKTKIFKSTLLFELLICIVIALGAFEYLTFDRLGELEKQVSNITEIQESIVIDKN